jgi:hypothetical protein
VVAEANQLLGSGTKSQPDPVVEEEAKEEAKGEESEEEDPDKVSADQIINLKVIRLGHLNIGTIKNIEIFEKVETIYL